MDHGLVEEADDLLPDQQGVEDIWALGDRWVGQHVIDALPADCQAFLDAGWLEHGAQAGHIILLLGVRQGDGVGGAHKDTLMHGGGDAGLPDHRMQGPVQAGGEGEGGLVAAGMMFQMGDARRHICLHKLHLPGGDGGCQLGTQIHYGQAVLGQEACVPAYLPFQQPQQGVVGQAWHQRQGIPPQHGPVMGEAHIALGGEPLPGSFDTGAPPLPAEGWHPRLLVAAPKNPRLHQVSQHPADDAADLREGLIMRWRRQGPHPLQHAPCRRVLCTLHHTFY